MRLQSARRALADSALALLAACAAIAMFLPPMVEHTVGSVPRIVALGGAIALGVIVHWALLLAACRRMGRPPVGWLAMAVLLFPVGSAAALLLLAWILHDEPAAAGAH
ncbi:MAG: hypothetical protein HY021_14515 [Burkholderiales bacterium]|nr:hypothetical protein [Burkholderiales bacterium]